MNFLIGIFHLTSYESLLFNRHSIMDHVIILHVPNEDMLVERILLRDDRLNCDDVKRRLASQTSTDMKEQCLKVILVYNE